MLLQINNLRKSYGNRIILDNISIQIDKGETIAIVGPSGSGKTTLLNMIGAIDKPDRGAIILSGEEISDLSENKLSNIRNREIGFIFQMHYLLPQCTLLENVLMPTLTNKSSMKNTLNRALTLLERVGLKERQNQLPGELSGGECQRTAFVRALINEPKILLADEPTGSLDMESARIMSDLLLDLNKENDTSLIVVTHSQDLAAKMSKTYQLRNGKLLA